MKIKKNKKVEIMKRINNLLSKTVQNGCTPQEAAAAATMAQKLIAQHHVDMREFNESEEVGSDVDYCTRDWQTSLATVIAKNTCCEVVFTRIRKHKTRKRRLTFIGHDTDRLTVLTLYDKLVRACQLGLTKEKQRYKERHGTTAGVEYSYTAGFIGAVLEAMEQQCRALMLVTPEDVNAKVEELFPDANIDRIKEQEIIGDSFLRGRADGQDAAGRKSIAM